VLNVTRSGRTFAILPLKKEGRNMGLIHCMVATDQKIDYAVVSECLVPLLLKHEGALDCEECHVKFTLPESIHF
jgi:hypothetical protein